MGEVATEDRQSTTRDKTSQAKARMTRFGICSEEDYRAIKRGWVGSKYLKDHPVF